MSYRATLDASHKVTTKGGHHAKFMRHIARDVDRANGVVHPVANDNVDWSRTQHNRTMVYDGNGGFRPAKSSDELIAATDDLLAQVKNQQMPNGSWRSGIRSNSVVLRPLVLSLPNEWYDEHSPGWRDGDYSPAAERLHASIEEFALSRFPARNVPGYSWHCDESLAAQLQLAFVPLADDGRLSQGDFFTGPKHLRKLHKDFREFLRNRGYDIEMKSSERSREHLDSDEFQQRADQLRECQVALEASIATSKRDGDKLWEEREQVRAEKASLDADRAQLDRGRQDWADELPRLRRRAREEEVGRVREETAEDRRAVAQDRATAARARQDAQQAAGAAKAAQIAAEERLVEADALARALDKVIPKSDARLRPVLDKELARWKKAKATVDMDRQRIAKEQRAPQPRRQTPAEKYGLGG